MGTGGPRGVIPTRATWHAEPAKIFDNLYFIGTKVHSAWALKGSDGIIVIDTLFNYAIEDEMVNGLKKLHLDPARVKYVIISHAHGDHDEGAHLFQERYGAHVVMGAADWDGLDKAADIPGGKPSRDIVGSDGQVISLGDLHVTLVQTPGHTPGTLSMIFTVKDHGKPVTIACSGGTAIYAIYKSAEGLDTYIQSQRHMAELAAAAGATVLMTNHSEFDSAWLKSRLVKVRAAGEAASLCRGQRGGRALLQTAGRVRPGRQGQAAVIEAGDAIIELSRPAGWFIICPFWGRYVRNSGKPRILESADQGSAKPHPRPRRS